MGGWHQTALDDGPRCCYLILDNSHMFKTLELHKFIISRGGVPPCTCNVIKVK
jgi:hypothetical protein